MAEDNKKKPSDNIGSKGSKPSNTSDKSQEKLQKDSQAESLKKLNEQLRSDSRSEDRKEAVGGFVKKLLIILLIVILLAGIGVAIYFFAKNTGSVTSGGVIKLSIAVSENIDNMSPDNPSISTSEIYPGDQFGVKCIIRNADSITGDNDTTGQSIFVRFSITLELDGVQYNNIVIPVIPDLAKENWHIYNKEEEVEGYVWDGYYYYYGSLIADQSLTLFEEVKFDFHNTTNAFGGRDAKIIINVEAVQADINNIGEEKGDAWNTAPRRWINNMTKGIDNSGNRITI